MWKSFITNIDNSYSNKFNYPASEDELLEVEKALNVKIPKGLRNLLHETNGLNDGTIMTIEDIRKTNLFLRNSDDMKENFMPIDCLLFFSDAGNGDYFGYPITNGDTWRTDIYVWNHEDDSRTWVASSLKNFLKIWISGQLSI